MSALGVTAEAYCCSRYFSPLAQINRFHARASEAECREELKVPDFMLLMHSDAEPNKRNDDWQTYLDLLNANDALRGGSAIGAGECVRRFGPVPKPTHHLVCYVMIKARDWDHARQLVQGNPVYEAGGTIEIRELPETG